MWSQNHLHGRGEGESIYPLDLVPNWFRGLHVSLLPMYECRAASGELSPAGQLSREYCEHRAA